MPEQSDVRRYGWLSLIAASTLACQERVAAPGACPEYCPPTVIEVFDTLLIGTLLVGQDSVVQGESFRGYVRAHEAAAMQLISEGQPEESRGVIGFGQFSETVTDTATLTGRTVVALDSFRLEVRVRRAAAVTGRELVVHRLPFTVDSLATFTSLAPFFADSTVIATIPIPDTLSYPIPDTLSSDTLAVTLAADAFPSFQDDSLRTAVGLALRSNTGGYLNLGSIDGGRGARLTRFVQVESGSDTVETFDGRNAAFDTYVFQSLPDPAPDALAIGGAPSARAVLRVSLPPEIGDSAEIVRATLILIPDEPVIGAPGDILRVRAAVLATDIGAKSPVIPSVDSLGIASTLIPVGSSDTVLMDITRIVRPWRTNPGAPRAFMLTVASEAAGLGEVRVKSTRSGTGAPALRVTYVPLFRQGGQ